MASYVFYPGTGTQTDWAVPFPYLSTSHVKVSVAGVEKVITWLNGSLVRITPAPAAGTAVLVQRVTQKTPMTVFENTNNLTAENLTLAETQALFIAEEASDRAALSIAVDNATGQYNFLNRRATNVVDPVDAQDAVTKHWAETAMSSQLQQATSEKSQAVTARQAAEAARDLATSKAAATAADATTTSGDRAVVRADRDTVAADKATVAGYRTDTASDRAQTGADRIATSLDRTAVNNAITGAVTELKAQTAADRASTAADRVQTGQDRVQTGADRVATGQDVTAAQTARTGAETARAGAEAARDAAQAIVGKQTAAIIDNVPQGSLAATNVQAAINELDAEKAPLSHTHPQSDITGLTEAIAAATTTKVNKSGDTMSGPLTINSATAASGAPFYGSIGNKARWGLFLSDGTPETGANAGSNLVINRYSDAGVYLGQALSVTRKTGLMTIEGPLQVNSAQKVATHVIYGDTYFYGDGTTRPATQGYNFYGSNGTAYFGFDGTNFACNQWVMSPRGIRYIDGTDGAGFATWAGLQNYVSSARFVYAGEYSLGLGTTGTEIANAAVTGAGTIVLNESIGLWVRYRYLQYYIPNLGYVAFPWS